MERLTFLAPAKLNLYLDITGKREDGYHLMEMVMQSVDLYDIVEAVPTEDGLSLSGGAGLPGGEDNLVIRAAQAFFRDTGIAGGARFSLQKKIPAQAGMGGGSADAAAALCLLNKMYGAGLSVERLMQIGLTVGADVPFCLHGGTALVEGIGERVAPLPPLPGWPLVVVKPECSVSTAQAFASADTAACRHAPGCTPLLDAARAENIPAIGKTFYNVFEEVLNIPEVEDLCGRLLDAGAAGARMTGSGSAVFGLFPSETAAKACLAALRQEGRRAFLCHPVPHGPVPKKK